jgi:septal ring factor EnvC (AmiA/AmiB activator)
VTVQAQQEEHEKKLNELRAAHAVDRQSIAAQLAALQRQADERAQDGARVHDDLCAVRAQLAQVHTEYENMYEEQVVPAKVRT